MNGRSAGPLAFITRNAAHPLPLAAAWHRRDSWQDRHRGGIAGQPCEEVGKSQSHGGLGRTEFGCRLRDQMHLELPGHGLPHRIVSDRRVAARHQRPELFGENGDETVPAMAVADIGDPALNAFNHPKRGSAWAWAVREGHEIIQAVPNDWLRPSMKVSDDRHHPRTGPHRISPNEPWEGRLELNGNQILLDVERTMGTRDRKQSFGALVNLGWGRAEYLREPSCVLGFEHFGNRMHALESEAKSAGSLFLGKPHEQRRWGRQMVWRKLIEIPHGVTQGSIELEVLIGDTRALKTLVESACGAEEKRNAGSTKGMRWPRPRQKKARPGGLLFGTDQEYPALC